VGIAVRTKGIDVESTIEKRLANWGGFETNMTQDKATVETSVEFLKQVLEEMEGMWRQIDSEWGPTEGGLEESVADGREPLIAELRRLTEGALKRT
jgi:hypothetical protein